MMPGKGCMQGVEGAALTSAVTSGSPTLAGSGFRVMRVRNVVRALGLDKVARALELIRRGSAPVGRLRPTRVSLGSDASPSRQFFPPSQVEREINLLKVELFHARRWLRIAQTEAFLVAEEEKQQEELVCEQEGMARRLDDEARLTVGKGDREAMQDKSRKHKENASLHREKASELRRERRHADRSVKFLGWKRDRLEQRMGYWEREQAG